jgi:HK97 family phage prohead protease
LDDGHKVKFFHSHDPRMVLGVPLKLAPDKKGLYTRNKISKTKLGEETRQLLMDGAMDSFSIGYRATDVDYAEGGEVRQLKDVDLFEISLVALPMNQEAVVTRVKDYYHLLGIAEQGSSDEAGEENRTTLVERSRFLQEDFRSFSEDVRALVAQIDRPLSKTKRQELNELLELCSRLDAVRSDLSSVLAATPESLAHLPVTSRRLRYDLAESRKRLARIYEE